jgi:uncharacterized membrane protein YqiK
MVETLIAVVVVLLPVVAIGLLWARCYIRVERGWALVVNKMTHIEVFYSGALVLPFVHRAEHMDTSLRTVTIDRNGKDGLVCGDKIRADVVARFLIHVKRTTEGVLEVAATVGCARAADPAVLEELFSAKFSDALETVAAQLDFEDLHRQRVGFRDRVLEAVGEDLHGFQLEDVMFDHIQQTPVEQLDARNILDAAGIKKIVETTERQNLERLRIESEAHQRRLELDAQVAELERLKADALARLQLATGKNLSEADLRAKIATLLVEHYGPKIDADQAQALVDADAQSPAG